MSNRPASSLLPPLRPLSDGHQRVLWPAAPGGAWRFFTLWELVVLVVVTTSVLALMASFLMPNYGHDRELSSRVHCAGNLKQIGLSTLMYSGDHGGHFPNAGPNGGTSWYPVGTEDYITSVGRVWTCPSATLHAAQRGWPHSLRDELGSDYRYIGSGLKDDDVNANTVSLGYDLSGNHRGNSWVNVLFVDGSVEGARPGTKPGFRND